MKISFNIFFILLLILAACGCQNKKKTDSSAVSKDTSHPFVKNDTSSPEKTSTDTGQNNSDNNPVTVTQTITNDFSVIYATSQQWHGGIKGSGGGTNYDICIKSFHSSSQMAADELWVGEKYFEIAASRKFPLTSADGFSAGDTLYINASDYRKDADGPKLIDEGEGQKEVQDEKQKTPPPYRYSGEALIGYKMNGTRKYKEVAIITVKQPLFYP